MSEVPADVVLLRLALTAPNTDEAFAWSDLLIDSRDLAGTAYPKHLYDQQVRVLAEKLWREYVSPRLAVDGNLSPAE